MSNSDLSPVDSYDDVLEQMKALLDSNFTPIANMANMASLLYWSLEGVNWVGFYLFNGKKLTLGPFHGKPACVVLDLGKGVCGTAAERRETIVVPDVDEFRGHIQCDTASRSEIVVPVIQKGELFGVLDLDSPRTGRFNRAERELCEASVRMFNAVTAG